MLPTLSLPCCVFSLLATSSSTWSNRCIQRCRCPVQSSSSAVCPETLFLLQPLLRLHLKSFPLLYGKDSKILMVLLTVKEENCCHLQGSGTAMPAPSTVHSCLHGAATLCTCGCEQFASLEYHCYVHLVKNDLRNSEWKLFK